MELKNEMLKMQLETDIKKYLSGAIIEPDMKLYRTNLKERANKLGLSYEILENEISSNLPKKRNYQQFFESISNDGLNRGLYVAFNELLKGNNVDVRTLNDQYSKETTNNNEFFSPESRNMCRMDILRALLISLKNDTQGYDKYNNVKELRAFLNEKQINPYLLITKEQLDYIHCLDYECLDSFCKNVDVSLLPQKLYESSNIWGASDKVGDRYDYLYTVNGEVQARQGYRVYINTPQHSNLADEFLTDYIKMCISKKIPYSIKGSQDKKEETKDNTVLYLCEEHLLDYMQILDRLSVLHRSAIKEFGEPPLMTQDLYGEQEDSYKGWLGFSDMGDYNGTYNDRTNKSIRNAFMIALYSSLQYKSKLKLQEQGFDIKSLSRLTKFDPSLKDLKRVAEPKRIAVFTNGNENEKKGISFSPFTVDGTLESNKEMVQELIEICKEELMEINNNPKKKMEMFEKFKKYYVFVENYFKYNAPKNRYSMSYTYEDIKDFPTSLFLTPKLIDAVRMGKKEKLEIFSEQEIGKATIGMRLHEKQKSLKRIQTEYDKVKDDEQIQGQ